jgi:hypothetical protein
MFKSKPKGGSIQVMNGKNTKTFALKKPNSSFWIFDAYWKDPVNSTISFHVENLRSGEVSDKVSFALNLDDIIKLRDYLNEIIQK